MKHQIVTYTNASLTPGLYIPRVAMETGYAVKDDVDQYNPDWSRMCFVSTGKRNRMFYVFMSKVRGYYMSTKHSWSTYKFNDMYRIA